VFATWFLAGRWLRPQPAASQPVRFVLAQPHGTVRGSGMPLAISPDGRSLAFAERDISGKSYVWVRRLDSLSVKRLDATEGAASGSSAGIAGISWSTDSQSILFFAGGERQTVAASGGPAQVVSAPEESVASGSKGPLGRNRSCLMGETRSSGRERVVECIYGRLARTRRSCL
jgi:WD40 repeat protein